MVAEALETVAEALEATVAPSSKNTIFAAPFVIVSVNACHDEKSAQNYTKIHFGFFRLFEDLNFELVAVVVELR